MRAPNYISQAMNSEHRLSEQGEFVILVQSPSGTRWIEKARAMHETVAWQKYGAVSIRIGYKKKLMRDGKCISRMKRIETGALVSVMTHNQY